MSFEKSSKTEFTKPTAEQCALWSWAARYNTWLLIEVTPKGIVFAFLFFLCFMV